MMSEKRYYVSCAGYLCDKDLSNTLSIFECADLLNQLTKDNEQLRNKLEVANARSGYYQRMFEKWCVKDE